MFERKCGADLSWYRTFLVPKCLGAELSLSTGAEMSWCQTVLFPLSNTESETNRNALVTVQFSANLPRKTSTNSTASSIFDVSCRSNLNVSSYCANTNMSSEISSMFYGAVLHDNTLNVNLYTNPHSWALYCLTALLNTFLWISSVCWNKWLIFLFSLLCLGYTKLARTVDV